MKIKEHTDAIKLRIQGFTYPEISKRLGVSRGSLSDWLRKIPYQPRKDTLIRRKLASIKAGQVLHKRKIRRVGLIFDQSSQSVASLTYKSLHLLGSMAYWAEGSKTQDGQVAFTNTDPFLIRLVYEWWIRCCKVNPSRVRLHIRVHRDTEKELAEHFWRNVTGIQITQCQKTTIKNSSSGGRRPNKIRNGIASIKVCDTNFHYQVMGWVDGLKQKFLRFLKIKNGRESCLETVVLNSSPDFMASIREAREDIMAGRTKSLAEVFNLER